MGGRSDELDRREGAVDASGHLERQLAPESRRPSGTAPSVKKAYVAPHLEAYGDLRTLTLGGSPGVGDSGGAFSEFPL